MKANIPIPGTAKARLLEHAIEDFGTKGYDGVNVVELAQKSGVTTGSLYHHFGNKLELYKTVRAEMERRVLDRMEGASAVIERSTAKIRAALLVGFDAAVKFDACRLLGEQDPSGRSDQVAELLAVLREQEPAGVEHLLVALWRAALLAVADGQPADRARSALAWALPSE
ncbi:TetR/AcrR family transcriptional regulator [Tumebacillus lipolyticus]|uniref:TetR/AcrR family transcriptional regulator n=1 Tax=Tumebacillus lipolyticus TaxID=1280370 RepID=A0ABW5A1U7_9BACL